MNPAGNGQGYEMDVRGRVYRFGPSLPPTIGGPYSSGDANVAGGVDWGRDIATEFLLDWATKRWAILTVNGHVTSNPFTVTFDAGTTRPLVLNDSLYRAMAFRNPSFPPSDTAGWVVTRDGRPYSFNGADVIVPLSPFPNQDVVRDLNVISDGLAGRPLILEEALSNGNRFPITVSSPPIVNVTVLPAPVGGNITTTTRPIVAFDYTDPDGDAMASARVRLFTSAQYGAGGFNPATSTALAEWAITDPLTFSQQIDLDLANGAYRAYVQATDSAGDVSLWAFIGWTQNVTRPGAPIVTTDPDSETWTTTVTATAAVGVTAGMTGVIEYSDDGSPWEPVRGAFAPIVYPTSGPKTITVVDWEAPFNVHRSYRARTLSADGTVSSLPSATVDEIVISAEWVLSVPTTGVAASIAYVPQRSDTRDSGGVALQPIGRTGAVVVRSGAKAKAVPAKVRTMDRAEHDAFEAIVDAGTSLQLRSPYESMYVAVVGDIERTFLEVAPDASETQVFAFAHEHSLSFVEVERPT